MACKGLLEIKYIVRCWNIFLRTQFKGIFLDMPFTLVFQHLLCIFVFFTKSKSKLTSCFQLSSILHLPFPLPSSSLSLYPFARPEPKKYKYAYPEVPWAFWEQPRNNKKQSSWIWYTTSFPKWSMNYKSQCQISKFSFVRFFLPRVVLCLHLKL